MKAISDEVIIQQLAQEFNAKLFATLVNRYRDKVVSRCKTLVKDEDLAQDLTQEVFVKVFLRLGSFKSEAKFSTWLDTIATNTCLDHLRKDKSKKTFHEKITDKLSDSVSDLTELEEDIPEELSIQILEELLSQLPPEDKMILLLKYDEKTPIKEIQTILNLSESAVKMRLKRARERITKLHKKLK